MYCLYDTVHRTPTKPPRFEPGPHRELVPVLPFAAFCRVSSSWNIPIRRRRCTVCQHERALRATLLLLLCYCVDSTLDSKIEQLHTTFQALKLALGHVRTRRTMSTAVQTPRSRGNETDRSGKDQHSFEKARSSFHLAAAATGHVSAVPIASGCRPACRFCNHQLFSTLLQVPNLLREVPRMIYYRVAYRSLVGLAASVRTAKTSIPLTDSCSALVCARISTRGSPP